MINVKHYLRTIRSILYSFFREKKFEYNKKKIRYVFKKAKSSKLLIVFPAVSKKPMYNYILTLKNKKINILFLKDNFGKNGSYFIGVNNDFFLTSLVDRLLEKIMKEHHISEISCIGSSKGGSSALFYACLSQYQIKTIICGSPQYHLGEYFYYHNGKQFLEDITGNSSLKNAEELDLFCVKTIKETQCKGEVILYSSSLEDDFHIKEIEKLTNDIKTTNMTVSSIDAHFIGHSGLANSFKNYILKNIEKIMGVSE